MSAVHCLERGAAGWPEQLEDLAEPPERLWIRGALPAALMVAVVGARRSTAAGMAIAREIGRELAWAGAVVVSGMARGIDGAAHAGALAGGGETVAVLGCGIDCCYPPEHLRLRDAIAARGAVISELPGEAEPVGWRFPRRNRIIAALATAVIVVEATPRSGALSTARWAADLGREVLAVPGSIRSDRSLGTNLLIRDGAHPYLELADLVGVVPGLRAGSAGGGAAGSRPAPAPEALLPLLDAIGTDPIHPDELGAALGADATRIAVDLTTLELQGLVRTCAGGRVARTF